MFLLPRAVGRGPGGRGCELGRGAAGKGGGFGQGARLKGGGGGGRVRGQGCDVLDHDSTKLLFPMLLCQNYYIYELSAHEHPLEVTSRIFFFKLLL